MFPFFRPEMETATKMSWKKKGRSCTLTLCLGLFIACWFLLCKKKKSYRKAILMRFPSQSPIGSWNSFLTQQLIYLNGTGSPNHVECLCPCASFQPASPWPPVSFSIQSAHLEGNIFAFSSLLGFLPINRAASFLFLSRTHLIRWLIFSIQWSAHQQMQSRTIKCIVDIYLEGTNVLG